MRRRPASLGWLLLARLALALSLTAPHAGHAGAFSRSGDSLVMVICGAGGAFEVALEDEAPPARAAPDPCCMMGCAGLPPVAAPASAPYARPAAPPPAAAWPPAARLSDAPNARDPPVTR